MASAWLAANVLSAVTTGDDAYKDIILYVVIGVAAVALIVVLALKDKIFRHKDQDSKDEK